MKLSFRGVLEIKFPGMIVEAFPTQTPDGIVGSLSFHTAKGKTVTSFPAKSFDVFVDDILAEISNWMEIKKKGIGAFLVHHSMSEEQSKIYKRDYENIMYIVPDTLVDSIREQLQKKVVWRVKKGEYEEVFSNPQDAAEAMLKNVSLYDVRLYTKSWKTSFDAEQFLNEMGTYGIFHGAEVSKEEQ